MQTLGEKIRILREEKGLTQPELAKLVGVSNGTVSFWENSVNEPKASYLGKLAVVFEVTSDYLLGLEDETGSKIR